MRYFTFAAFLFAAIRPAGLLAQPPADSSTSQIRKDFVMGHTAAVSLEQNDGQFDDAPYVEYLQSVMKRIADAAGQKAFQIRITRSSEEYALLLPPGTLYLSAALLERVENEAELGGLFAHQLAHRNGLGVLQISSTIPSTPVCALASRSPAVARRMSREAEIEATKTATATLKQAGYDPLEMLGLLSKLAYEHPAWSRTIAPMICWKFAFYWKRKTARPRVS